MKNTIVCNADDYSSLRNGEYLSHRHDGKALVVDNSIHQGKVISYDEHGAEEEILLRD